MMITPSPWWGCHECDGDGDGDGNGDGDGVGDDHHDVEEVEWEH